MRYTLCLILSLTWLALPAQLLPLMLNNRDNAAFVNPAMTGVPAKIELGKRPRDYISTMAGVSSRMQWTGFGTDGPFTNYAKISQRLSIDRRGEKFFWGGVFFMDDNTGLTSFTSAGINTSYHQYLGNDSYLHAGISIRFTQSTLGRGDIRARNVSDEVIDNFQSEWFLNSGIGVFYSSSLFYFGASLPNTVFRDPQSKLGTLSNHYYGTLGGYLHLRDDEIYLEPSIWVRTADRLPFYYDLGLTVNFYIENSSRRASGSYHGKQVWAGVGYDAAKALRVEAGIYYEKVKFSFIYNHYLNNPGYALGSGLEGGLYLIL